jgi:hypothetical protein
MTTEAAPAPPTPRAMLWAGRVLSALFVLFMAFDIGIKIVRLPVVDETMIQLGYPPEQTLVIWILELISVALYLFPRTWVLGAVLMMGVLGGSVATHMRIGDPLTSHTLFGVYLGLLMWGGIWLRDPRLRAIFPVRRA